VTGELPAIDIKIAGDKIKINVYFINTFHDVKYMVGVSYIMKLPTFQ